MINDHDAIQLMIESAERKRLSSIVGAAVSVPPPSCAPSWFGFRDEVLEALANFLLADMYSYHDVVRNVVQKLRNSSLAPEVVFEGIDRFSGMSHVRRFVSCLAWGKPNHNHRRIAALMEGGVFQNVITPNWDGFLEDCLADRTTAVARHAVSPVIHLHGQLGGSNFIQAGHFRIGFHLNSDSLEAFTQVVQRDDCLVLGYSGRDLDIVKELEESARKNKNRVFWSYLTEHGMPAPLRALATEMPECFIPIPIDTSSTLDLLCKTFHISAQSPASDTVPSRSGHLVEASRGIGHVAAYLVFAFCLSNLGEWNDARWFCEFATDAAHSRTLHRDGPHLGAASEAYRFAALCTACSGEFEYAGTLSRLGDDDSAETSLGSFKRLSASYLQKSLIALCGQDLQSGASWLQRAVDAYRVDHAMHPDHYWPMLESAIGNGIALFMALSEHPDAVRQNEEVVLGQWRSRNVCGHCCTLLSLALSYYKKGKLTDARLALNDCVHLATLAGNLVCANAARTNLDFLDGVAESSKGQRAPVKDAHTGWLLSVDPFALYFGFPES